MIRFENVSKSYPGGAKALREVSFRLDDGEMAFLTGHSGAGKSTLLRLVLMLERATRGQVVVALLVEHALVGLVAGLIGILGASVLAWFVLTRGLEMEATFPVLVTAVVLVVAPLLAATVGAAASAGALARRPLEAIRRE